MNTSDKSDRALLDLAAKAAGDGLFYQWTDAERDVLRYVGQREWNPLEDDGDAFRLMVKLRLQLVQMDTAGGQPVLRIEGPGFDRTYEILDDDPYAATRRAIVRAAAAIGASSMTVTEEAS